MRRTRALLPLFLLTTLGFALTSREAHSFEPTSSPRANTTPASRPRFPSAPLRAQARALRAHTSDTELRKQAADPHVAQVLAHSQTNGHYYLVSDLHMGLGKKTQDGAYHPEAPAHVQEDFMRPEAFIKTLRYISTREGNNTLAIGGDWLDLIEHVPPRSDAAQVKAVVSSIVNGHQREFKALADAVVNRNLRVVYIRGNHDIHLVDPELRAHFLNEVVKVAGLDATQAQVFKGRVAFAGHLAPLGKYGEGVMLHGDEKDLTNNWRNPANPYSYTADGRRDLEPNLGYHIVQGPWKLTETKNPNADNLRDSSTKRVVHGALTDRKQTVAAFRLLREVSKQRVTTSDRQELAELMDDRRVLEHWADLTGFAAQTGRSAHDVAATLHDIYRQLPKPAHERMTSMSHVANAAKLLAGAKRALSEEPKVEATFLQSVTDKLPQVKYVFEGHDHAERVHLGAMDGKPRVGFYDTGTWTMTDGEDRLNMVVVDTDTNGHVKDGPAQGPKLRRVNPTTGRPELEPRVFGQDAPVSNWQRPKQPPP